MEISIEEALAWAMSDRVAALEGLGERFATLEERINALEERYFQLRTQMSGRVEFVPVESTDIGVVTTSNSGNDND